MKSPLTGKLPILTLVLAGAGNLLTVCGAGCAHYVDNDLTTLSIECVLIALLCRTIWTKV